MGCCYATPLTDLKDALHKRGPERFEERYSKALSVLQEMHGKEDLVKLNQELNSAEEIKQLLALKETTNGKTGDDKKFADDGKMFLEAIIEHLVNNYDYLESVFADNDGFHKFTDTSLPLIGYGNDDRQSTNWPHDPAINVIRRYLFETDLSTDPMDPSIRAAANLASLLEDYGRLYWKLSRKEENKGALYAIFTNWGAFDNDVDWTPGCERMFDKDLYDHKNVWTTEETNRYNKKKADFDRLKDRTKDVNNTQHKEMMKKLSDVLADMERTRVSKVTVEVKCETLTDVESGQALYDWFQGIVPAATTG